MDHRGLPHTLEHLIFTGSKNYPQRGYLDKLATTCLSNGTNAYTSDDHTCYTVTTASLEGLLELLPVYLDHIVQPCLLPSDMALEVFSLEGKDARGVVYCEMKSREYTEADQMDLRLRALAYEAAAKEDPSLQTYRWECGGSTQRISHLSPGEIVEYHRKFYQPNMLTIFVAGMVPYTVASRIARRIAFTLSNFESHGVSLHEGAPLVQANPITKGLEEVPVGHEGLFPADDESIGSVGFSWLGPHHDDVRTILALHVLLRALRESTASPLYQEFVECLDPWAIDIDYDIKFLKRTLICLIFSGVPTGKPKCIEDELSADEEEEVSEDDDSNIHSDSYESGDDVELAPNHHHSCGEDRLVPGMVREKMFALFERLLRPESEAALTGYIQTALKSFTLKIREQFEEDPHELAFAYCIPEILHGAWKIGTGLSQIPQILQIDLPRKPLEFWKDLLVTYLGKETCHEVQMRPSKTFSQVIKQREEETIDLVKQLDMYPKMGTALLDCFQQDDMPSIAFPNLGGIEVDRSVMQSDEVSLHIVQLSMASFSTITIGFNIRDQVDSKYWPYLVLLQELIFQSDVRAPLGCYQIEAFMATLLGPAHEPILEAGKLYSYQELQQLLTSLFTHFEASMGLGNELFSASHLDSHLILSGTFPNDSILINHAKALECFLLIMKHSIFSAERVKITIDNLYTQLAEAKRDPSTILDAVFNEQALACLSSATDANHNDERIPTTKRHRSVPSEWICQAINTFTQENFLANLKSIPVETVIATLNAILQQIFMPKRHDGFGNFIHAGGNRQLGKMQAEDMCTVWKRHLGTTRAIKDSPSLLFANPETLPRYGLDLNFIPESLGTHVIPMADVTASYLACSIPLPVLPSPEAGIVCGHDFSAIHDFFCVVLFCSMQSFTEGPLYNRVRGKGLAYGASLSVTLWNGLLCLDISDSTAPFEALQTSLQLIHEVEAECDKIIEAAGDYPAATIMCPTILEAAKASFLYQAVFERATPSSLFGLALHSVIRGGYPVLNSSRSTEQFGSLQRITLLDIALVIKPYLTKFQAPSSRLITCVVPPSILDKICQDFERIGAKPTVRLI